MFNGLNAIALYQLIRQAVQCPVAERMDIGISDPDFIFVGYQSVTPQSAEYHRNS